MTSLVSFFLKMSATTTFAIAWAFFYSHARGGVPPASDQWATFVHYAADACSATAFIATMTCAALSAFELYRILRAEWER